MKQKQMKKNEDYFYPDGIRNEEKLIDFRASVSNTGTTANEIVASDRNARCNILE